MNKLDQIAALRFRELVVSTDSIDIIQLKALKEFLINRGFTDFENIDQKISKSAVKDAKSGINLIWKQIDDFATNDFNDYAPNDFSGVISIKGQNLTIFVDDKSILSDKTIRLKSIGKAELDQVFPNKKMEKYSEKDEITLLTTGLIKEYIEFNFPEKIDSDKPILVHITDNGDNEILPIWIHFLIGQQSHPKIIFDIRSSNNKNRNAKYLSIICLIKIFHNARLDFLELQDLSIEENYNAYELLHLDDQAQINYFLIDTGASHSLRNLLIDMDGQEADAKISGIYYSKSNQERSIRSYQNHYGNNTKSNLLFKGILDGQSNSIWEGNVYVKTNSKGVDGYQRHDNLIISPQARMKSIPGLEIITDDVKCSHGVTVSNLDSNQLFYLQSRGIEKNVARELIKEGFFLETTPRTEDVMVGIIEKTIKNMFNY